jgi:hypothetical protein
MLRNLVGFFVAPFPVALFQSLMVGLWPKAAKGIFEHPASMFVAMCLYFYMSGLLIGLPGWLVVRHRWAELKTYTLLGPVAAILPIAAGLLVMARARPLSAYTIVYDLMLFGLGGVVAGELFWLIAVRRRPRTDSKEIFR